MPSTKRRVGTLVGILLMGILVLWAVVALEHPSSWDLNAQITGFALIVFAILGILIERIIHTFDRAAMGLEEASEEE